MTTCFTCAHYNRRGHVCLHRHEERRERFEYLNSVYAHTVVKDCPDHEAGAQRSV